MNEIKYAFLACGVTEIERISFICIKKDRDILEIEIVTEIS